MMGLLVLDLSTVPGGYSFERFREFLAERLHLLPPLRRRLLEVPGGLARPFWIEEPEIDLDLHLRRAAVPSPGGRHEVAAMAAEIMERPLDRTVPLWEMALVEGLEGGHLALLAKLHHAMMDGMAGVKLMASLFGTTPEVGAPPPASEAELPERVPGRLELLAGAVPWLFRQPRRAAAAGVLTARSAIGRARSRRGQAETPAVPVPRSWLNAEITPHRTIAYQSLALADLRAVGRPLDATLNDVLLAVMGGALRRYLGDRSLLPAAPLVAGVPLAVRDDRNQRANAMTSVSVSLATDLADPAARLRAISNAMAVRKRKRGRTVGDVLAAWADVPPPAVFSFLSDVYLHLHLASRIDPVSNLIVSSVPGPPESLYLAGARLAGIYPLGPIYDGLTLNVTAMGCADSMDIGLVACRGRLPDLWALADAIPEALAELAEAVRLPSRVARVT